MNVRPCLQFLREPNVVARSKGLSDRAKRLFGAIWAYESLDFREVPGVFTLAYECGWSRTKTRRVLKELEAARLVEVWYSRNGRKLRIVPLLPPAKPEPTGVSVPERPWSQVTCTTGGQVTDTTGGATNLHPRGARSSERSRESESGESQSARNGFARLRGAIGRKHANWLSEKQLAFLLTAIREGVPEQLVIDESAQVGLTESPWDCAARVTAEWSRLAIGTGVTREARLLAGLPPLTAEQIERFRRYAPAAAVARAFGESGKEKGE